nr:hypothetical protein [uncultured Lichenicoccus sp.]
MTPERFAALADAHGGSIEHWPAAMRDAARAFLLLHPEAGAALEHQARLDATLAAWTVPGPGAALSGRILMQAGARRRQATRLRLWFSGLGAAGVLAGGLAAGAAYVTLSQPGPDQVGEPLYEVSVLGTPVDPDEPATSDTRP